MPSFASVPAARPQKNLSHLLTCCMPTHAGAVRRGSSLPSHEALWAEVEEEQPFV